MARPIHGVRSGSTTLLLASINRGEKLRKAAAIPQHKKPRVSTVHHLLQSVRVCRIRELGPQIHDLPERYTKEKPVRRLPENIGEIIWLYVAASTSSTGNFVRV